MDNEKTLVKEHPKLWCTDKVGIRYQHGVYVFEMIEGNGAQMYMHSLTKECYLIGSANTYTCFRIGVKEFTWDIHMKPDGNWWIDRNFEPTCDTNILLVDEYFNPFQKKLFSIHEDTKKWSGKRIEKCWINLSKDVGVDNIPLTMPNSLKHFQYEDCDFLLIEGANAKMYLNEETDEWHLVGCEKTMTRFRIGDQLSQWYINIQPDGTWWIRTVWSQINWKHSKLQLEDDPVDPFRKKIGKYWIKISKQGDDRPLFIPKSVKEHIGKRPE